MALSSNREQLEIDKFKDESNVPAIRIVATTASGTSGTLAIDREQNELNKFVEDDSGNTAVVILVA